jgi:hypothetical protein
MDDNDVVGAVSDYMRAEINRAKWMENEIIDESVAQEFENKLSSYWLNQRKNRPYTVRLIS